LHRGDRQRPRAGVPKRDVLEELLSGRPARTAAIMADDPEHQEYTEDEEAKAPFGEAGAQRHDASPLRGCSRSTVTGRRSSLNLLDVAGLPALVDRGLGRAVEPKDGEVALARNGREPVAVLPGRRGRAEIHDGGAIRLLSGLVARALGRKRLAVGIAGRVL